MGAPAMSAKCVALRLLWSDEVEAAGADTIGHLKHSVCLHISAQNKFRKDANKRVRLFGRVNMIFLADWSSCESRGK